MSTSVSSTLTRTGRTRLVITFPRDLIQENHSSWSILIDRFWYALHDIQEKSRPPGFEGVMNDGPIWLHKKAGFFGKITITMEFHPQLVGSIVDDTRKFFHHVKNIANNNTYAHQFEQALNVAP